jgi:hypothetical protein
MMHRALFKTLFAATSVALLALSPVLAQDNEREGGLTGTGVVGEITALGSIIVNAQRITFADDLAVTSALGPTHAANLVPGDTVAVAVDPSGSDWTATAITQTHALIGPVAQTGETSFTALGVPVTWPTPPAPGTWVAVSGFWTPKGVQATRVQAIDPRPTVSLQGSYRKDPKTPASVVGTVTLEVEPLQNAKEGDVIRVTGMLHGDTITVTEIDHGVFPHPVGVVLAEGYLTDVAPSGHYTVGGSGLSSYTDNLQSIMTQKRVTVCGTGGQLGDVTGVAPDVLARLGCDAGS